MPRILITEVLSEIPDVKDNFQVPEAYDKLK